MERWDQHRSSVWGYSGEEYGDKHNATYNLSFACLKNNLFSIWLIFKSLYFTLSEGGTPSSRYLGQNTLQMADDGVGSCSLLWVSVCGETAQSHVSEAKSSCPTTVREEEGNEPWLLQKSFAPVPLTTENAFTSVLVLLWYQCTVKTLSFAELLNWAKQTTSYPHCLMANPGWIPWCQVNSALLWAGQTEAVLFATAEWTLSEVNYIIICFWKESQCKDSWISACRNAVSESGVARWCAEFWRLNKSFWGLQFSEIL